VKRAVETFFAALSFLTRIRTPRWVAFSSDMLERSVVFFPVVGALVGLWGALLYRVSVAGWPSPVAAVVAIGGTILLTGALHEDALADACDGFGGGWDRAAILRIMKDSRIGAYGAIGVGLSLLARTAAIIAIAPAGAATVMRALVVAHVLSRWTSVPLMWRCPYVREGESKSRSVTVNATGCKVGAASVVVGGIVLPIDQGRSMAAMVAAVVVTTAAARYFNRRLGGITGDCLGAVNQVVELTTYLMFAWHRALA
jgi:adenosylcobinamide-GDP ribazoletransferase